MDKYLSQMSDLIQGFGVGFAVATTVYLLIVFYRAAAGKDMSDLITSDAAGNKVSHTKFWSNVAYTVTTISLLKINFDPERTHVLPELWLIYLGTVAGHATAAKWISTRLGNKQPDLPEDEAVEEEPEEIPAEEAEAVEVQPLLDNAAQPRSQRIKRQR
jgi:hypothetical protein